jgi:hypothetical protein
MLRRFLFLAFLQDRFEFYSCSRELSLISNLDSEHPISRLARVNNEEEVAVRVLKDNETITWIIDLRVTCGPELEQPFHLTTLVVGIEVKMQPVSSHKLVRNLIQRHIHVSSSGVSKNHPAVPSWLSFKSVNRGFPLPKTIGWTRI